MANGTRVRLDDQKKREILAILAVGGSRRMAALYVGCAVSTIRNTAKRDPAFAKALHQADSQSQIVNLSTIQAASKEGQQWRAAAWSLERKNPGDFAHRSPETITAAQVQDILAQVARMILEEVPIASHRKKVVKRLHFLVRTLGQVGLAKGKENEKEKESEKEPGR